jgi:hypothetical protein
MTKYSTVQAIILGNLKYFSKLFLKGGGSCEMQKNTIWSLFSVNVSCWVALFSNAKWPKKPN